jgi:FkbM family methyltransferase
MTIPDTEYKVSLRTGTCDIILFYDIFLKEGYGKIKLENVETIIDCGANIGLASVFFLIQYPYAKVIALEPDPVNFDICQNNLKQFGSRAVVLNSALWHENCTVKINPTNIGTWASTVAPTEKADKTSVQAFDMQTIMQKYNLKEIDMLKIDIEGAEEGVFSSCNLGWLDKVKCIQIECENSQTEDVFINAVSPMKFELSRFTEIMIAVNKNFKKN